MYSKFGTKVTVIEGSDTILAGFDKDMLTLVAKKLKESRMLKS